jgi:hypothetical protein
MCELSDIWMLLLTAFIGGCAVTGLSFVLWMMWAMDPRRDWIDEHEDGV